MAGKFAVIGMSTFGRLLVESLVRRGAEVLAIDCDAEKLEDVKEVATDALRLDATDARALREQGLEEYDGVVVAMGEHFENALLAVAHLQQMKSRRIIVRASTPMHERILHALGIAEVVLPEGEAAERLALGLMFAGVTEAFALSGEYTIAERVTPDHFIGKTVQELDLRGRFGVGIVTVRRVETQSRLLGLRRQAVETILGVPGPDTLIERGDVLVLFGRKRDLEAVFEAGG
jgi:trk system potassium uptake protein TrkA